jgi:hypothetical protein
MKPQSTIFHSMLIGTLAGSIALLAAIYCGGDQAISRFNSGYAFANTAPYMHPLLVWLAVSIVVALAYDKWFN